MKHYNETFKFMSLYLYRIHPNYLFILIVTTDTIRQFPNGCTLERSRFNNYCRTIDTIYLLTAERAITSGNFNLCVP